MKVISITNLKGGVGKTTCAVCLSAALAEMGKRVLLIDFDPQAAASRWLNVQGDQILHDILVHDDPSIVVGIHPTGTAGLSILPSDATMTNAEKSIASEIGSESILRDRLSELPPDYDYILIDCPPSLNALTINALAASDSVLIPVEAHALALDGLEPVLKAVKVVRDRINTGLRSISILPVRVDARTLLARDCVEAIRTRYPKYVTETIIRANVRIAESPSHNQPITTFATHSTGAEDYRALAVEINNQSR